MKYVVCQLRVHTTKTKFVVCLTTVYTYNFKNDVLYAHTNKTEKKTIQVVLLSL